MRTQRRLMNESGQALLIAALLFVMLLVAIPIMVFVNRSTVKHSGISHKQTKSQMVAEEGLSYAIQQLSSSTVPSNPAQAAGAISPDLQGLHPNVENARFISQVVPLAMAKDDSMPVKVTFQNVGQTTWTAAGGYKLIAVNPLPNIIWDDDGEVPLAETVLCRSTVTFTFNIHAPSAFGEYQFQWGMQNSAAAYVSGFGEYSKNLTVRVQTMPGNPPNWPYLAGGGLPAPEIVSSAQGGYFSVSYSSVTSPGVGGLQRYQVGIFSRAVERDGTAIPGASIYAVVSQQTVGAKLPSSYSASAALDLAYPPNQSAGGSTLRVEMGPIVVRSTATWTLDAHNAATQRPRKFAGGAILPRTDDPHAPSDQKAYWAYTSAGTPSTIDRRYYVIQAQNSTCPTPPQCGGAPCPRPAAYADKCYFPDTSAGAAIFDNFTLGDGTDKFIYINGNAEFHRFAVDLGSGTFYVSGKLTLGNNTQPASFAPATAVYIPPTIGKEDPYSTCSGGAVCSGSAVDRHIDFRGFLYVAGGLHLNTSGPPAGDNNWTLLGAARVDGNFVMDNGTTLYVFYNDVVNHKIRTSNFDLQIDSKEYVR